MAATLLLAATAGAQSATRWMRSSQDDALPALDRHAAAIDPGGELIVFGGYSSLFDAVSADTWLGGASGWQRLAVPGPSARSGHALAFDASRQRVVLYGGRDANGVDLADVWEWDGSAWIEALSAAAPLARSGHALVYDESRQTLVLFGGRRGSTLLSDTWEFTSSGWVPFVGTGPSAREGHAMTFDPSSQRTLLFGGRAQNGVAFDTWTFDGGAWVPVSFGPLPPARTGAAMAYDAGVGEVVLFGGEGQAGVTLADTWSWDGTGWSLVQLVGGEPAPRAWHVLVATAGGQTLLLGGDNAASLPDAWSLTQPVTSYGTGCGAPPLAFDASGQAPAVGQLLQADVRNNPTSVSVVTLGFRRDVLGTIPLPISLVGIGMPGCQLLHSADIFAINTTPAGAGSQAFALALPNDPQLIDRVLYGQAFAAAPGQNLLGLITSNALAWRIGCAVGQQQISQEFFAGAAQLDESASSGLWLSGGSYDQVGGDARHGDFDLSIATATGEVIDGRTVYELDGDETVIPGDRTTTATPLVVTDGRFFFATMHLPADVHLRLVGSSPVRMTVSGTIDIEGVVESNGESPGAHASTSASGQAGGRGGAGAGDGGQGADRCLGTGPGTGQFDGRDGDDAQLPAGHAYAGTEVGTGGRGSSLFPATGLSVDQQFGITPVPPTGLFYCLSAVAGGGGGGYLQTGGVGRVVNVLSNGVPLPNQTTFMGPQALGGSSFTMFPLPTTTAPAEHLLVGGSGGGGAASNATLSLNLARSWASGSAGGGGGGAFALRAGRSLTTHATARLEARGGNGFSYVGLGAGAQVAPAGGGSGGSVFLRASRGMNLDGIIDVRGGSGGQFDRSSPGGGVGPNGGRVVSEGGDGAPGIFRRSSAGLLSSATLLPAQPFPGAVPNTSIDDQVAMRSLFYSVAGVCPTEFESYRLEIATGGQTLVFSDDPAISPQQANVGALMQIYFQAGRDLGNGTFEPVGPWRPSVRTTPGQTGISVDGGDSYRFLVVLDRTQGANIVTLNRLSVRYRN